MRQAKERLAVACIRGVSAQLLKVMSSISTTVCSETIPMAATEMDDTELIVI